MPAYIHSFLEQSGGSRTLEKNRYCCRVCARVWKKRAPENKSAGKRPSLVRLSEQLRK